MAIKYLDAKRIRGSSSVPKEASTITSGLKAYYNCDSATVNNNATSGDSLGSSANGTNNGADLNPDDEKFGTGCLNFNGSTDYVACNGVIAGLTTAGTISVWCNFDTLDVNSEGGGKICAFGDADGNTFIELSFIAAGALSGQGRLSGSKKWAIKTANSLLTTTGWHHCVLTHDGSVPRLYVNGVEDTSFTEQDNKALWISTTSGLDEFRLGMQYHSGGIDGKFDGLMDDVGIWNRALTQAEITSLYATNEKTTLVTAGGTTQSGSSAAETEAETGIAVFKQITGLTAGRPISHILFDFYDVDAMDIKYALYDDDSNTPDSRLGNEVTVAISEVDEVYTTVTVATSGSPTVPSDGIVWVAMMPEGNTNIIRRCQAGGSATYTKSISQSGLSYATGFASTASATTTTDRNYRAGVTIPDESNLPENTLFEETDTRILYWLQSGKWNPPTNRGVFNYQDELEYINPLIAANATVFGSTGIANTDGAATGGNATYGAVCGVSSSVNDIARWTFATIGSSVNWGNLNTNRKDCAGCSNDTRMVISGGDTGGGVDSTDMVELNSSGTASNFKDVYSHYGGMSFSSATRAVVGGGYTGALSGTSNQYYMAFATGGSASSSGSLSGSTRFVGTGASNSTTGLYAGGYQYSDYIQKMTIASLGTGVSWGELSVGRHNIGAVSTEAKVVFGAGQRSSGLTGVMDQKNFDNDGNCTTFGDLSFSGTCSGVSDMVRT